MKILLLSLGSRGDMDPFLAVGAHFAAAGWEVVGVMPAQFGDLVRAAGFRFLPLDRRFCALLDGHDARAVMGQRGNPLRRGWQLRRLYRRSEAVQHQLAREQRAALEAERPDRVLFHPLCFYPPLWDRLHPGRSALLLPVPGMLHPLYAHPPIVPSTRDFGPRTNRLLYRLTNRVRTRLVRQATRPVSAAVPRAWLTHRNLSRQLHELPAFYSVSPALFTPPPHWPGNARVAGYYARTTPEDYTPSPALRTFLATHPKRLFITFGSMINAHPVSTTRAVLAVLAKHRIPAILNTFSGGLVQLEAAPAHVHFTARIPYGWIFPQMHGVVHHGGSGTTHMAVRSGCATLVVPHIFDQYYWNWVIQQHQLGPAGLPIKQLTPTTLEPKLLALWENETYKTNAEAKATLMQYETDPAALVGRITEGFG